jgi:Ser/Thr protein kinase RdoA (MazF antagonist)
MNRALALEILESTLISHIRDLYQIDNKTLKLIPGHDGCQNVVYSFSKEDRDYILRISFRKDRSLNHLLGEMDFIEHLQKGGARVSTPIRSTKSNYVEAMVFNGNRFLVTAFTRAPGTRLPDNGYVYRKDAPLDEYFHNYGRTLGKFHALAKEYRPAKRSWKRPDLVQQYSMGRIISIIPDSQELLRRKFSSLATELEALPRNDQSFGLIHGDFGDGNLTIDYLTGDITVFDFDDAVYGWFMYEIADAWSKGFGRAMHLDSAKNRKLKMDDWYSKVLTGYAIENKIPDYWLEKLPLFLKALEMLQLLEELENMLKENGEIEYDEEILYMIRCVSEDIPYFGFFDSIYSAKRPFSL